MSRGLLGRDSPIHIRQNRRGALKVIMIVTLHTSQVALHLFAFLTKAENILWNRFKFST